MNSYAVFADVGEQLWLYVDLQSIKFPAYFTIIRFSVISGDGDDNDSSVFN